MEEDDGTTAWADQVDDDTDWDVPQESRGIKLAIAGAVVVAMLAGSGWWLWRTVEFPRSSEEYLKQARASLDSGQARSALIDLKNALQQDDGNLEARFLLGKLYFDIGEIESAEKELRAARALGQDEAQVLPLLARVYLAQGKHEELLALEVNTLPDAARAEVLTAQGLAHMNIGDADKGVALVEEALTVAPENEYTRLNHARLLASRGNLIGARTEVIAVLALDANNPGALMLLGDIEVGEGSLDAAEVAYSRAMEAADNPTPALLKRAHIRIQKRDFEQAQADVDALMARVPNNPSVHYFQGVIHFQHQEFQSAITSLAAAEEGKQLFPLALLYAGVSHHNLGNSNQAREYADRFHKLAPDNDHGRRLLALVEINEGDFVAAETAIRAALAAHPDDEAWLNLLANVLLAQGNSEEGTEVLSRVAELRPDSSAAQVRLGAGSLFAGDQSAGVERLESALALDPDLQQADMLLVLNYARQQDYGNAIAAAEAYQQRHPSSAWPFNVLGRVYLAAGQHENAGKAFLKALQIEPAQPGANHGLAEIAMSEGDYTRAKTHYDAILAARENYLPTLQKLARMAARQNDEELMVAYLQRAMESHPREVSPRVLMGRYYLSVRRPEQVQQLFSDLDQEQKNLPQVLNLVGQAQFAAKDFPGAKSTFRKLSDLTPRDAQVHQQLARAHAALGEIRQMELELEKTLALAPDHVPAIFMLTRLYLGQGNADKAAPQLVRLRALTPDSPQLPGLEAAYARLQGDEPKALALEEKAYADFPSSTTLLQLVAALHEGGNSERERKLLMEWLDDHPQDARARLALAAASGLEQDSAAAVEQYLAVLELEENSVTALNNLAWHFRTTAPARALSYAEKAAQLAPDSAAVQDTLAMVLVYNGELQRASKAIGRALDRKPSDPSMGYHSALISARLGDQEAARKRLAAVLDSGQAFPEREAAKDMFRELGVE